MYSLEDGKHRVLSYEHYDSVDYRWRPLTILKMEHEKHNSKTSELRFNLSTTDDVISQF